MTAHKLLWKREAQFPLSWPGNAHWLTGFIIFDATLWGLQRKQNILICQRAHFYFDFFLPCSHEWGISSCSNLKWKELTVFARERGGTEGNLSIQPRLPTAVKRMGVSQPHSFTSALVLQLLFLPVSYLEANLQVVRKARCTRPSSKFKAADRVPSKSSFSLKGIKERAISLHADT